MAGSGLQNRILYEDNHLIVVNKLPSEIIQADKTGDQTLTELVKLYLKEKYNKPGDVFLGTVHRIDRPVSGVVLFARTSKALKRMNEMIKNREVEKKYWAIVKNEPPELEGSLVHYLKKDEQKNKSFAYLKPINYSKEAKLSYVVIAKSDEYYLLEVNLVTGRHHQIRAQLSKIGCPIKGDLKYGFPRSNPNASISLHARSIEFAHPVQKTSLKIVCNPPDDVLWNYFVKINGD
jgi:23S rRNA pseudouridine1911/1915/1917 synthase